MFLRKETRSCGWLRHSGAVVVLEVELVAFGRHPREECWEGISALSLKGKLYRRSWKCCCGGGYDGGRRG